MKPKRIILVRHGQSEGNLDEANYERIPDYKLQLTPWGEEQALAVGKKLKEIIGDESVHFYVSPLWRTRATFKGISKSFKPSQVTYQEEPRIREQEWGHLKTPEENKRINEARDTFGTFYYRLPDGESGADVYDRICCFLNSLHRHFEENTYKDNIVIVAHGLLIRLFLMKWYKWTVEEFETYHNPLNCEHFVMELNDKNKYTLLNTLKKREVE